MNAWIGESLRDDAMHLLTMHLLTMNRVCLCRPPIRSQAACAGPSQGTAGSSRVPGQHVSGPRLSDLPMHQG